MPNSITDQYLKGLQERLSEADVQQLSYASGATEEQITALKTRYPECPASLIQLLQKFNGTYWQEYGQHTVAVLMLGSDVDRYPYYLKSADQMLDNNEYNESICERYGISKEGDTDLVGIGIDPTIKIDNWLCFSDCTNNGGTSKLYIDFNPAANGRSGQVVRFLHDPDNYTVIAGSFDEYLQLLINKHYDFIGVKC
ncbi:SMI1/KNR4 family protein [Chitinophaga sp. Hz27]|uniref:SMI1/KNR4 family protein n=1 Tax=Chitinophaga sp. Hz27 TaxID=3347169 RepID=UPI0035D8BB15